MEKGLKILNLYAGIGGNRKLWGDEHDITAVEIDPKIADIYTDFFPNDKMVIGDAHEYLEKNYEDFDFIWSSPPCPTHSKMRYMHEKKIYPDLRLYEEIIFLKNWFSGRWVVENVEPYYDYLVDPTIVLHRHAIWSNFHIPHKRFKDYKTCKKRGEREFLQEEFGFDLEPYSGIDKRKVLRNCVLPELGLHILEANLREDKTLFAFNKHKD